MRFLKKILITGFLLGAGLTGGAAAQPEERPREISSDDFKRPKFSQPAGELEGGASVSILKEAGKKTNPANQNSRPAVKKVVFRLRRSVPRLKAAARPTAGAANRQQILNLPKTKASAPASAEQIGVTLWRLRPAASRDEGARLLVQEATAAAAGGAAENFLPERVAADTFFRLGDRVRLSIESPRAGFLYVIDREIYSDGSFGEPYLIFPTRSARGGDNRVSEGVVTDLPQQTDRIPFFTLKSGDARYRGESLMIVVSPIELPLQTPDKPVAVSREIVAELAERFGADADEYEQEGSIGKSYTAAEQQAGRDATRQLTQDEPLPQTVYRLRVRRGDPLILNLTLTAK